MANAPAYKANIGKITVTVWRNTTQDGKVLHSTEFTRSYQDSEGNWKNGTSFNHQDLPVLEKLLERAELFIFNDKSAA